MQNTILCGILKPNRKLLIFVGDVVQKEIEGLQRLVMHGNEGRGDYGALEALFHLMAEHRQDMLKPYIKPLNDFVRRESLKFIQRRDEDSVDLWRIDELRFKSYALGAVCGCFDDYLIANEYQRDAKARFWLPRRGVLEGKHQIASKIDEFINDKWLKWLFLEAPPGVGKSALLSKILSREGGAKPHLPNLYCTYAGGMVKVMYDRVSDITTNTSEYLHSSIFQLDKPTTSAEYLTISYRDKSVFPTFGFVSIGGSATGRTRSGNLLVVDDLVKDSEEARSPSRLSNLYDDFTSTMLTRTIGDDWKLIMAGTPWSLRDPITRFKKEKESEGRSMVISIPVWDEHENSNFEYDHPEKYTRESIYIIKATQDPADFFSKYLMQPMEKAGCIFSPDTLNYYPGILPRQPDRIIAFCDPAFGGGDSVSVPIGYVYNAEGEDEEAKIYIHDVIFDNSTEDVTVPRVAGMLAKHDVSTLRTEGNSGGLAYKEKIEKHLTRMGFRCKMEDTGRGSNASKISRVEQNMTWIKNNVYFLDSKRPQVNEAVKYICQSCDDVSENNELCVSCRSDDIRLLTRMYRSDDYNKFMQEFTTLTWAGLANKHVNDDSVDSVTGLAEMLVESKSNQFGTVEYSSYRPF